MIDKGMIITISLSRQNLSLIQAIRVARANGENVSELIRKLAEKGMDCHNHDNQRLAQDIADILVDKLGQGITIQPQQNKSDGGKVDLSGLLGD